MTSISIIIPVYNVAKYVERCLESVENQDYAGEMECIIVDDCGNDNSMTIVNNFISCHKDSKIKYLIEKHTCNLGLSSSRNTGIKLASKDYLFFLDSDDEIPMSAMSLLANETHIHRNVDIVMGFMYSEPMMDYYNIEKYRRHQFVEDANWLRFQSFKNGVNLQVNATNKLIRKAFVTQNNLYFYPNIIHEDNLWMFKALEYIKSFAFVYEPTYIRYFNKNSITQSLDSHKEKENWQIIIHIISQSLNKPFRELKFGRYCSRYFNENLFEQNPYDRKIVWNFIKTSLYCGYYKLSILLLVRMLFPNLRRDLILASIKRDSNLIFNLETQKYKNKYTTD